MICGIGNVAIVSAVIEDIELPVPTIVSSSKSTAMAQGVKQ